MTGIPKAKGQRTGLALGETGSGTTPVRLQQKSRKSNGCVCLADCIADLHLHELEIDRLLDSIVIVQREEEMHWDCPRVAIRRAVQHLQRIGMATDAMLAGVKL